ncbi:MAG: type II toxin-antitoxin system RelE/ParE family toxin [Desulfuromusa sp.]|nr:type II toxin-antitoxin system RelE/ParE family toxin [Desulfuromusa sp.]
MAIFTLTKAARSDLKDIARFTQKRWGLDQRNKYLTTLDDCFHQLASNPAIGRACNEIKVGYYKFPAGSHMIFYRKNDDLKIKRVRVLHENMDIEMQFSKS